MRRIFVAIQFIVVLTVVAASVPVLSVPTTASTDARGKEHHDTGESVRGKEDEDPITDPERDIPGSSIPESEWDDDVDNCPAVANRDQGDFDHDEIGNLCDPDSDADNVNEVAPDGTHLDNCWLFWNPVQEETGTQRDYDNDGVGFGCDDDELVPRIYVINGMTRDNIGTFEHNPYEGYLVAMEQLWQDRFQYPEDQMINTVTVYDDPFNEDKTPTKPKLTDPIGGIAFGIEKGADAADVIKEALYDPRDGIPRFTQRLYDDILEDLQDNPLVAKQKLLLIGHSGGGAMAANLAAMLNGELTKRSPADEEPIVIAGVVTLGSPAVNWPNATEHAERTLALEHYQDFTGRSGSDFRLGLRRTDHGLLWAGSPEEHLITGREGPDLGVLPAHGSYYKLDEQYPTNYTNVDQVAVLIADRFFHAQAHFMRF